MKVFVLGTGGWGIALAMLLHQNGHEVTSWTYLQEECDLLHRERCNEKLLPGVVIPEGIEITTDMSGAAKADLVVLAVPSFAVASTAERLAKIVPPHTVIVNVGKGLDSKHGYCRFSETISNAMNGSNPVVALTGPTHAEEVARGIPTAIVAASESRAAAELTQAAFMNDTNFRVYTSSDIIGCELGGAFKNIIALGAGISDGLGLGDNSKAAFMTRGLTEIARLGVKLGAKQETFAGLSGVGDLIVTCCSMHSRNRRAGILIGKGATAQEAMKEVGATVEGYYAELTQAAFMNDTNFRVYTSSDIIGCELGGAFKNIIALGAGISDGLGLGDNSKAAFMTRGLTEIARLGVKLGAKQETFAGLSGVGDLIVTCCSMHSRNRRAGILIGKGATAQEAMKEVGATVEGYYATEAGYHLAQQQGVSMPITEAMYAVLYGGMPAQEAIKHLLNRPRRGEHEEVWVH